MSNTIQTINFMRVLRLDIRIDIEKVYNLLGKGKLYRGRPQMLVMKMKNSRNLQLFPSGVIQVMGNHSHSEALSMCYEIINHLRKIYPQVRMKMLTLKNLVVSAQLKANIPLHRVKSSSSNLSYEVELFPAMLIRRFYPVHIAVFHTGRCILTGLKSIQQANDIVDSLQELLLSERLLRKC